MVVELSFVDVEPAEVLPLVVAVVLLLVVVVLSVVLEDVVVLLSITGVLAVVAAVVASVDGRIGISPSVTVMLPLSSRIAGRCWRRLISTVLLS